MRPAISRRCSEIISALRAGLLLLALSSAHAQTGDFVVSAAARPEAEISRGGLARGLMWLGYAGVGGVVRDLIIRGRFTSTTQGTGSVLPGGPAMRDWAFSASGTTDLDWTSGAWTVGAFVRVTTAQGSGEGLEFLNRCAYASESNNQGWCLSANGNNPHKFRWTVFRNNATANYSLDGTTTVAVGDWVVFGTSDGTTRRIYVNGTQEATTTNNAVPVSNTTVGLKNVTASTGKESFYIGYVWSRELSAGEIRSLSVNPWRILEFDTGARFDPAFVPAVTFPAGILNNPVPVAH